MGVVSYKCPNCGGEVTFDPVSQKYRCPYCLSYFDEAPGAKKTDGGPSDDALRSAGDSRSAGKSAFGKGSDRDLDEAMVYTCPSCGAELITDATTAATFCYYCHSPVVLEGRVSGEYLPDQVIPFQLDKNQAVEAFLAFGKKKKFVPRAYFGRDQIEKITGVYYPYWVCNAEGWGDVEAEATLVRVWRAGETEYTETKVYHVERSGEISINEIMRNALKKADHQLAGGVWPYRLEKSEPFSMSYLSGFQAEKRDLERGDLEQEVQADIQKYGEYLLKDTIKEYSTVNVKKCHIQPEREEWKYVLLPVWVLTYRDRAGKLYHYAMNGQTGTFAGELPLDKGKLAALFFGVALPVLVLLLIGGYLL